MQCIMIVESFQNPSDQQFDWCFFSDVTNLQTLIITIIYSSIVLVLFVYTIHKLRIFIKLSRQTDIIFIYSLILLWELIIITLNSLSLTQYYLLKDLEKSQIQYQHYPHYVVETIPTIIVSLDMVSGPAVMTILMIVPYFWIKSIKYYMQRIEEPISNAFYRNLDKIIIIYLFITRVLYIGAFITFYFLKDPNTALQLYKNLRISISSDSLITTLIIILGRHIFIHNFSKLALVNTKDNDHIKHKFNILIIVCFIRLAMNLLHVIDFYQLKWHDCLTDNNMYQILMFSSVFLTHTLPITIVLWIYNGIDSTLESKIQHSLLSSSSISEKESFLI